MSTHTDETIYVNEDSGEVTCADHGGRTLASAITHARAGQQVFAGINGERFIAMRTTEFGCEYC